MINVKFTKKWIKELTDEQLLKVLSTRLNDEYNIAFKSEDNDTIIKYIKLDIRRRKLIKMHSL